MNEKKIAFHTLGCKLNFSETSAIARRFAENGFDIVDFRDVADIYVVHSCCVTRQAEKKCLAAVRQARKRNPAARLAVIGCFAGLNPSGIRKEGVEVILGNSNKFSLPEVLAGLPEQPGTEGKGTSRDQWGSFVPTYSAGDRTRSFLKIQDGCDYHCAYCTIPKVRGRSRSDTIANTLDLAKEISSKGILEVVLTGVNIGDFGKGSSESLLDLIRGLENIPGIARFRLSSVEPDLLSDGIIDHIAKSKKFLPHFHIPLQSGCDKILRLMRRRYTTAFFAGRVRRIRAKMPEACIAVDVIAGFPGETAEDFLETVRFLEGLEISYAHVFTYSEREDTSAVKMEGAVAASDRHARSLRLHELSERKKNHFYRQQVGKTASVLFESDENGGFMFGFTGNYVKVKTPFNPELVNQVVEVKLLRPDTDGIFLAGF